MKALAVLPLLLLLAGCGAPPAPPLATEDATAEFKPFVDKLMNDWTSLDPAKMAKYYAKEPGVTFYDIAPLKYNGWQEYEAGTKKVFADWKSIQFSISPDVKAFKQGNIAWVTFTSRFEIALKNGQRMKGEARSTEVLEKRGTEWIIVHEHVSAPMPDEPPPPAKK
jgi:ketosteroid isomerase-like protein